TYTASASATSGLPVALTIDASASAVCTIAGATVSFIGAGTCVINANQAGNAAFNAAPQLQQSFAVVKANQSISFTSTAPAGATVGGATYAVTATATSGLAVAFTIDAAASAVCTIAGATVSFIGSGTCVVNANQAGNGAFNAAPQVQQSFAVQKASQTITFTSVAPTAAAVGGATYTVTATASSGLAVAFSIDASASAVCSIAGATVSFLAGGSCVINANQAGNANFNAAPQLQQAFAVTAPPVATNDTYPETIIGNVKIDSSLIAFSVTGNDTSAQAMTITAFDATSTSGGTVTMTTAGVGLGQFTYDPPPGFTGADTFNYTVTNLAGSRTAQVTINISASAKPWFVDVDQATNGDGRLTRPFNTLASLQAINDGIGAHPKANDTLFLYESASNYSGPITLLSGQKLIGQDATTGFDAASAITFTASALPRPVMNSANGTRATIVSAGAGISIGAAGNTVRGLSIGNSTDAISASAFGTLTVADVSINTNGRALNLVNGALAATFDSVTAAGGLNGVTLTNTTGTVTLGAGALSGASGATFAVTGGTATISYGGTITQSNAARVVDIQNKTGGTVTFSGAITSSSGTGLGINLNTNTGATINFTGGITLTTNANNAFAATNGGTINVTQNNTSIVNTLTTTTGIALNIANTTIGASGITFRSIASNGATNGVVVNTTGSSGGLTITGNGGTCTSAANCTGGAIQNSTGDGVVLTSTFSPSLTRLNVTDAAGTAADDGIVMTNVTGSVNIDSCAILNSPHNGVTVDNFNTNMANFNFANNTVSCAAGQLCQPSGSIGNDGLLLQMRGTSVLTSGVILTSTFSGHRAAGVQIQTNDNATIGSNAGGSIINSVTVQGNTLTGNGQGIDIDSSQVSNLTFQVLGNTINGRITVPGAAPSDASSNAINAFTAAGADTGPATHSFVGKIDGNVIGTQGVKDSGSGFGSGIRVVVQGGGTQGNVVVNNNTIRETANADVMTFIGQNGAGVAGSGTAKFKITNNSMPTPSGSNLSLCGPANTPCASNGIFVLADEGNPVCSVITGNTVFDVVPLNGIADLYLAARTGPPPGALLRVEGTGGSNADCTGFVADASNSSVFSGTSWSTPTMAIASPPAASRPRLNVAMLTCPSPSRPAMAPMKPGLSELLTNSM
ncbi:MAG: Ig-like domain-containing protein, partial [Usitatibacteraceae bacterium]